MKARTCLGLLANMRENLYGAHVCTDLRASAAGRGRMLRRPFSS
eukprot:CAMPEP_0195082606 /NCGR_PEP_ID=MMETSP0448-20130528/23757_1 /TAXON_ID=66468 /ORGANISM="Heterocapsa triquestra, Strain CCMP 448" /LENGTH=43 /DNA_ID= /DNA_START= /DNA_END= /DNA_ORIENTATION=